MGAKQFCGLGTESELMSERDMKQEDRRKEVAGHGFGGAPSVGGNTCLSLEAVLRTNERPLACGLPRQAQGKRVASVQPAIIFRSGVFSRPKGGACLRAHANLALGAPEGNSHMQGG